MRIRTLVIAAAVAVAAAPPAVGVPPIAGGALASDNVDLIASYPDVPAVGGRMVGRYLYVTTLQGVRIYDTQLVPGERIPVPVGAFPLPHVQNEDVDTNGEILLVSQDDQGVPPTLYVVDVRVPQAPVLLSVLRIPPPNGHTVSCVLDCTYAWIAGSDRIRVVDLRDPI